MAYKVVFNSGVYEAKRDLDKILRIISSEEINDFQNFVMKNFTECYNRLERESIKFEKEQLKIDVNLGLKTEEEYRRKLKKLEGRRKKIEDKVKEYIKGNLKIKFHPKYPALLTYSIEKTTRTGWLLILDRLIFENGKIKGRKLIYHGKNFKDCDEKSPLIELWNSVLIEYFKLLSKKDN